MSRRPQETLTYTLDEAAHHLRVSSRTLRRWRQSGEIRTIQVCGRPRILASDLADLLAESVPQVEISKGARVADEICALMTGHRSGSGA